MSESLQDHKIKRQRQSVRSHIRDLDPNERMQNENPITTKSAREGRARKKEDWKRMERALNHKAYENHQLNSDLKEATQQIKLLEDQLHDRRANVRTLLLSYCLGS